MNGTHTTKKKRSKGKPHIFIDPDDGEWCYSWDESSDFDDDCGNFVGALNE